MDRNPRLSIILFDWSVRESYHAVEYLSRQEGIARSDYELIWIEYYGKQSEELACFLREGKLDKYVILGREGLYRKHELINEGILQASGDIVVNCDSDALFSPTFAANILKTFEENSGIILYLDEVRNRNKKFYPFSYPDWEDVLTAPGVVNWDPELRMTPGVALDDATLQSRYGYGGMNIRNYGACLCVRREDLLRVGGADEHETYDGFICGIYELGWRLVNAGLREMWHKTEYILHVYHPWIKPERDLLGPHKNFISTTAIKNKEEGMVFPLVENPRIKSLRLGGRGLRLPGPVQLSVVVHCRQPHLLDRLCDSVSRAFSGAYQVVAVGPRAPQTLRDDLHFVESEGSSAACLRKGLQEARGTFVCWAVENAIFLPGALSASLDALARQPDSPGAVCLRCRQTQDAGRSWMPVDGHAGGADAAAGCPVGLMRQDMLPLLTDPWPPLREERPWEGLCLRLAEQGVPLSFGGQLCADLWGSKLSGEPGTEGAEAGPFAGDRGTDVESQAAGPERALTRPFTLYAKDVMERLVAGMSQASAGCSGLGELAGEVSERIPAGLVHYLRHKRKTAALIGEFGRQLAALGHPQEAGAVLSALADELLAVCGEEGGFETDADSLADAHQALAELAVEQGDANAAMRHVAMALLAKPGHAAAAQLRRSVRRPEFVIDA